MNIELLKLAVKNIENDPRSFDMSVWYARRGNGRDVIPSRMGTISSECGTVGCLAGHIVSAAGCPDDVVGLTFQRAALGLLGLGPGAAGRAEMVFVFGMADIANVGELKAVLTSRLGVRFDD